MPDPNSNNTLLGGGAKFSERYANPFYGIPLQFLPLNIDQMLWWADHFLFRFGFYRAALNRIANYFITELNIDCEDEKAKDQYKEIFEKLNWKELLATSGLNLLAYGNAFVSVNQGFTRFLVCPKCHKISDINRIDDFGFDKGKYTYKCPKCKYNGVHAPKDVASKDFSKLTIVNWNPREIKLRHERTTNTSEFYWDIPSDEISKISVKDNKFYSKKVPRVIYDAVFETPPKMIVFNEKNFIHLKMSTPASLHTDGKAIPLCIYMFDDFFMLKVLQRFNEAICFEDINPFRVIAMDPGTPGSSPILTQNGGAWSEAVDNMVEEHRRDPGSYHKFPFPINYQQLGGDGKNLAPVELMQQGMNNILNALNIPQELYAMTLQTQAVGPALRLFENSWSVIPHNYNKLLQYWGEVISKIKGLTPAKISLLPITFADDMERKSVIGQLVSSNSIARSEFLKLYGFDYEDQLRKKMEEDQAAQELQEEEQEKAQLKAQNSASIFNQQQGGGAAGAGGSGQQSYNTTGNSPQDILQQAQQIAQQLFPLDGAGRRTELQKIKAQNETLWGAVKSQLDQMTRGAGSQGIQQAKQQGQQPGGQGGGQQ